MNHNDESAFLFDRNAIICFIPKDKLKTEYPINSYKKATSIGTKRLDAKRLDLRNKKMKYKIYLQH